MTKNVTTYAQLNIGRNVKNEPMSDWMWEWFQDGTVNVLIGATHVAAAGRSGVKREDVQVHTGRGEWDGVPEDSAHISLFWEDGMDVEHIRYQAGVVARTFGQDAIAVIIGSELIG